MTSAYGESVKFYDRMSVIHEQLRGCEDEQFVLQEEYNRLWNQQSPKLSEYQVDKQVSFGPDQSVQVNGRAHTEGDINEQRRRRNQVILEKIMELESNASVFAARSEKLKVLRSEYDTIAKKFLANRGRYFSNPSIGHTSPRIAAPVKTSNTENLPLKAKHMDVGVNTEITGDIIPASANSKSSPSLPYGPYTTASTDYMEKKVLAPSYKSPFQVDVEVDKLLTTTSRILERNRGSLFGSNSNHLPIETARSEDRSKLPGKVPLQESKSDRHLQSEATSARRGSQEGDENISEKLKHNSFFDLSTTSESDLTSSRKVPRRPVPINIIMDDTTQSDTFSMSMQLPLTGKTVPPELLNLNITSESESVPVRNTRDSYELEKGPVRRNSQVKFMFGDGQQQAPILASTPMNKTADEEDNELSEASLSLTTSPGDSVMDSVQNKTLDESFQHDPKPEQSRAAGNDTVNFSPFLVKDQNEKKPLDNITVRSITAATSLTRPSNADVLSPTTTAVTKTHVPSDEGKKPENLGATGIQSPESKGQAQEVIQNDTFELEPQWNEGGEDIKKPDPIKEEEKKDEVKKDVQKANPDSISNTGRPKTVNSGSATVRRMRIKLDYDSDSEPSEIAPPVLSKLPTASQVNQDPSKTTAEDDDFDDFFDM